MESLYVSTGMHILLRVTWHTNLSDTEDIYILHGSCAHRLVTFLYHKVSK